MGVLGERLMPHHQCWHLSNLDNFEMFFLTHKTELTMSLAVAPVASQHQRWWSSCLCRLSQSVYLLIPEDTPEQLC